MAPSKNEAPSNFYVWWWKIIKSLKTIQLKNSQKLLGYGSIKYIYFQK